MNTRLLKRLPEVLHDNFEWGQVRVIDQWFAIYVDIYLFI